MHSEDYAAYGGAVFGNETLIVRDCKFENNSIISENSEHAATEPTRTPDPGPSPTAVPEIGVDLILSGDMFLPGDTFLLEADIISPEALADVPFVVLLDVYSEYYWYPGWTNAFAYERITVNPGGQRKEILNFIWPETDSSGDGIRIYSALLNQDTTGILGIWDMETFGWGRR